MPYEAHGRDRNGWDCWGLLRVVYAEQFAIELPSYKGDYGDPCDGATVVPVVEMEIVDWVRVEKPQPGDVLLVSMLGHESHVGVYVGEGFFLHVIEQYGTRLERTDSNAWKRRIRGYYRHKSR